MNNTPTYTSENSEKIVDFEQFRKYFIELDYSKRYDLFKDVFSENDTSLSYIFYYSRDLTPSEQAYLYVQTLPSDYIHENFSIIEDIFSEAEKNPTSNINILTIRKIITLCLLKKAGVRISFLNSERILSNNLPVRIRIDLSVLLVYLDPAGLTFELDIQKYPHLIPSKMLLYEEKPIEIILEFLKINNRPNEEIVNSIVERPLKKCLENLLIKHGAIKEYVEKIEPFALNHWSYLKINEHITSPVFQKHEIVQKIFNYKNFVSIPSPITLDELFNWFANIRNFDKEMEIQDNKNRIALLENQAARDYLLAKSFSHLEKVKKSLIASQFDSTLR